MFELISAATLVAIVLIAYHHVGWPLLLRRIARVQPTPAPVVDSGWQPRVTLVMPAHNEARFIAAKLRNLAALDYPADRLEVVVACDGCDDATVDIARAVLAEPECRHLAARLLDLKPNRGKVVVLNEVIGAIETEIVALTDVSAHLAPDALALAVRHFADPTLGAVGGTYIVERPGSAGESKYWAWQIATKLREAALGAPLGLHGAFWAFRRAAWAPLAPDTINDDFILPLQMFGRGWRVAYDPAIRASEKERANPGQELRRRRRIASGNAQQLARLSWLLHPRHGGVALAFASGKALRVLMPMLILLALLGSAMLARESDFFAALLALELTGIAGAVIGGLIGPSAPRPLAIAWYALSGHAVSFMGVMRYAFLRPTGAWRRAMQGPAAAHLPARHMPFQVEFAKRAMDIVIAAIAIVLTLPFWPLIALAIRLESKGPIIFRQMRIGRALPDRTVLFTMYKFRSMRADAEAKSGAVWASKQDPRITKVGIVLRKLRLDELPQLFNVLRGDMSLVGPRPERPGFYRKLEREIPFFVERTGGIRPGITGLAQVRQGYDTSIDDVRSKVAFDHSYAMALTGFRSWLWLDTRIAMQTLMVMAGARGQ